MFFTGITYLKLMSHKENSLFFEIAFYTLSKYVLAHLLIHSA